MKLKMGRRKESDQTYYIIHYANDDEGFFLYRKNDEVYYPMAILVFPNSEGTLAKFNWANWHSDRKTTAFSETFVVADKIIETIDEKTELDSTHRAVWMHCSMLIKKHLIDSSAESKAAIRVLPPSYVTWKKNTNKELDKIGEDLF